MKTRGWRILTASLAIALPLGWATPMAGAQETGIVERLLESASAPADHEVIADYYEKKAAKAKESAAQHRALADVYKKAGAKRRPSPSMAKHCEELAAGFEKTAEAYTALASEHREAAKAK